MASDELASRRFTFKVYFQPSELAPEVRQAAVAPKLERTDAAGYFAAHTSREPVRRVVIDRARCAFCAGSYADGVWVHNERSCQDTVHYKEISGPSDYLAVRVETVSASMKRAAIAAADAERPENHRLSQ
jgi:hypothetical protein